MTHAPLRLRLRWRLLLLASLALLASGRLFVRTDTELYAIGR